MDYSKEAKKYLDQAHLERNCDYFGYFAYGVNFYHGSNESEQSYEKAFSYLTIPAKIGSAEAHSYLGVMYFKGQYVEKNYEEAYKEFLEASILGDGFSMYYLGYMYEAGLGVEKDLEKSERCYSYSYFYGYEGSKEKAKSLPELEKRRELRQELDELTADEDDFRNNLEAQRVANELVCLNDAAGYTYLGEGYAMYAQIDYKKGMEYLKTAMSMGYKKAFRAFSNYQIQDFNNDPQEERMKYFFLGAIKYEIGSFLFLANEYFKDDYYKKDLVRYAYFNKYPADNGMIMAKLQLGECYLKGWGVNTNFSYAYELLSEAADNDFEEASILLGEALLSGKIAYLHTDDILEYLDNAYQNGEIHAGTLMARIFHDINNQGLRAIELLEEIQSDYEDVELTYVEDDFLNENKLVAELLDISSLLEEYRSALK